MTDKMIAVPRELLMGLAESARVAYNCTTNDLHADRGEYVLALLREAAQPAPDVAELVEALEDIAGAHHHSASAGEYFAKVARAALAAHCKQGGNE